MQWTMPCQPPHPVLMKHLDNANISHWKNMIKAVGTGNIRRAIASLQKLDVAINQAELDAGKKPTIRHDPGVEPLSSEWFLKQAVVATICCNEDDPRVIDFIQRYGDALTKNIESKVCKKAVEDLTKELDDLKINDERLPLFSSSTQTQQEERIQNRVRQSVAEGQRCETWMCNRCHCEKGLGVYSVRDQVRIVAHWKVIQTANWIDIHEDDDFVVVCKQCKDAQKKANVSSSA